MEGRREGEGERGAQSKRQTEHNEGEEENTESDRREMEERDMEELIPIHVWKRIVYPYIYINSCLQWLRKTPK